MYEQMEKRTCRGSKCQAEIWFVKLQKDGRDVPRHVVLDPEPHPAGNVRLYQLHNDQWRAEVLTTEGQHRHVDGPLYVVHQVSCLSVDEFRDQSRKVVHPESTPVWVEPGGPPAQMMLEMES